MNFSRSLLVEMVNYAELNGMDKTVFSKNLSEKTNSKYVPYEQLIKILQLIEKNTSFDHLGLKLGEYFAKNHSKKMGNKSNTEKAVLKKAGDESLRISDALTHSIENTKDQYKLCFDMASSWSNVEESVLNKIIEMTLIFASNCVFTLSDNKTTPIEIHFPFAKPKKVNEYFRVFDCSLQFSQDKAAIIYKKHASMSGKGTAEIGLLNSLANKAKVEIDALGSDTKIIDRIKKLLLSRKPDRLNLEEVAIELDIPARTLQRKLRILKTSFKTIENEILIGLAKEFLANSNHKIDEISFLLGFSEPSAFNRYFKKEMNLPPNKFRLSKRA